MRLTKSIKSKRMFYTIGVGSALLAAFITREVYQTGITAERVRTYTVLAAQEIQDRWQCLPESDRETYIFSLMDRFAPEDKRIIEDGRVFKKSLELKQTLGTLTVSERALLGSGYYQADEVSRLNGRFTPPSCKEEMNTEIILGSGLRSSPEAINRMCKLPYMSISSNGSGVISVVYEDQYSRWTLPHNIDWHFAPLVREYENFSWRERVARMRGLEQQDTSREQLKQKADLIIANMSASKINAGSEKGQRAALYKELLCNGE